MDAINDPSIKEIWLMKSAQVGWTEVLNNVIGYFVHQDPAPMLLVQPTLEMAEAWSKDRLAPMIRDTPPLRDRIADPKSRDSGNTLLHKKFTGGHLTIAGANSPAGLASRPIRIVLFDEVDRFPVSAGSEGDPISLGRKRSQTFWNRKMLAGSTPTIKGASRIEAGFESSDQRFYFVPCPHCDEFQRLVWSQVRWPDGRPEEAGYVCAHCGVVLNDADKQQLLSRGEWRASKPSNGIAGFHISELYSPWSPWSEMAVAFTRAKQLPETLQTWINTALGETWEDKGETLEPTGLMARRETYTAEYIPAGNLLVTVGVDVQDDRLEVFFYGWGDQEQSWLIDHQVLRGDPGGAELWAELDAQLKRRFKTDDGRELVVEAAAVDSGGHFTQHVYRYCAARKRFRIWAIKGMAGTGRLAWPKKGSRAGVTRAEVFSIGVDTIKSVIYGRLQKVTEPGPGYIHFPSTVGEDFFNQLTSEQRVFRKILGRNVPTWKPRASGIRQEALDGTVYAYAAMIGRGGQELLSRRAVSGAPVAAPMPEPEAVSQPEPQQSPQKAQQAKPRFVNPSRRRGWIKSW